MPRHDIPEALIGRPFTRSEAVGAGITSRMLNGSAYTRVFPRVWRTSDHQMTQADWIAAAEMTMPGRAHLTGATRLQQLGLDLRPHRPLHLVVSGDLHLATDGVFLHRTPRLPPLDEDGRVTAAAAFMAWCCDATVVAAVGVGDWLIAQGHMSMVELGELVRRDHWRAGAAEAAWVLPHLREGSLSIPESQVRVQLEFAGLPSPSINEQVPGTGARGDLTYLQWRTVIEYEGQHHQSDRGQYLTDIDRYAEYRRVGWTYLQITKEQKSSPVTMVGNVFDHLAAQGYEGPPPDFGPRWQLLYRRLSSLAQHRVRASER